MEDRLKSKNLKTVVDVHVQTDSETQVTTCCQTEETEGIDFEVQTDIQPDKNTMSTQTLKQENQEIAMPNRPSSNSSKPSKKRKLSCPSSNPTGNSRDEGSEFIWDYSICMMSTEHYLAPVSINLTVVSGRSGSVKAWREKNWSGSYHFVEVYNERPVYKVSFKSPRTSCQIKNL